MANSITNLIDELAESLAELAEQDPSFESSPLSWAAGVQASYELDDEETFAALNSAAEKWLAVTNYEALDARGLLYEAAHAIDVVLAAREHCEAYGA